jgi:hypothetical protein
VLSHYQGDLEVYDELTVTGNVYGRIIVHAGGALVLLGVAAKGTAVFGGGFARIRGVTHGLLVAAGGHATLRGRCESDAVNDGGELHINGAVTGRIVEYAGTTVVATEAQDGPPETGRSEMEPELT